jgi:hypothetical protein
MREVIYIAGPVTCGGKADEETICANVDIADSYYHRLVALGFAPICPHTMGNYRNRLQYPVPHDDDHNMWMDICLSILARCDSMLLLPGWETSTGSIIEEDYARTHNLRIYRSIEEIEEDYA